MISVVICSISPDKFAAVRSNLERCVGNDAWELIGVHDARSMAEGYNRAISKVRGDIVVFCHDDIELLNGDFVVRLRRRIAQFDIVGIAGTTRLIDSRWLTAGHPFMFGQMAHIQADGAISVDIYGAPRPVIGNIQAVDGVFMAVRRPVLQQVRFDETTFTSFHLYDLDFCLTAYDAGLRIGVANDIHLIHLSSGNYNDTWQESAALFRAKWHARMRPQERVFVMRWGGQLCSSREDAIRVMTPDYWNIS